MFTEIATGPENPTEYELLPPSGIVLAERQEVLMEQNERFLKPEFRKGDLFANYIAMSTISALAIVTWIVVLSSNPTSLGWFAFHPTLQTLSLVLFTYGISTLQPTSQPKTKAAGLSRHQVAIFLIGFPFICLGTSAITYNKWVHKKEHMATWHGTLGYSALVWIIAQVGLGGGSVWFKGSIFGGGSKAKAFWKYHRLSGYLLFSTLLFTAHLGGGWSDWGDHYVTSGFFRLITFTLAPLSTWILIVARIRPSKMKFIL